MAAHAAVNNIESKTKTVDGWLAEFFFLRCLKELGINTPRDYYSPRDLEIIVRIAQRVSHFEGKKRSS